VAVCANSIKSPPDRPQRPPVPVLAEFGAYYSQPLRRKSQPMHSTDFWASQWPRNPPCSTGGGPSGEFGAGNSPRRAGSNQSRGVRTEFDRRLALRQPPGGAAATTHVRGVCVCVCVCKASREKQSGGGAGRPVGPGHTPTPAPHSCPHGRHWVASCKSRRKESISLFKILASSFSSLGHSQATWSALSMG
jgi:hypothetical protein